MADGTKIEWTDATWNVVTGCSVLSPGCTNCYAMKLAGTRLKDHPSRTGLTDEVNGKHVWNGVVRFNGDWLMQPVGWKRARIVAGLRASLQHVFDYRRVADAIEHGDFCEWSRGIDDGGALT